MVVGGDGDVAGWGFLFELVRALMVGNLYLSAQTLKIAMCVEEAVNVALFHAYRVIDSQQRWIFCYSKAQVRLSIARAPVGGSRGTGTHLVSLNPTHHSTSGLGSLKSWRRVRVFRDQGLYTL